MAVWPPTGGCSRVKGYGEMRGSRVVWLLATCCFMLSCSQQFILGVPDRIAQLIVTDLRQGYADAVSWAFIAMAACMGVLVVLGLCYPRDGHRGRDVPVGRDDGSVRSGRGNDDD